MQRIAGLLAILCLVVPIPTGAADTSGMEVTLSSDHLPQGGVGLIRVRTGNGDIPRVTWRDKDVLLAYHPDREEWNGFIGVDLAADPGTYTLRVESAPSGLKKHLVVAVVPKDYGVRTLTLPKKMVDLDAKTLERAKKEAGIMRRLWEAAPGEPLWRGAFVKPVPGEVLGPFGRRSIINKQPRSPHSGVDFRGETGTPVVASNHGRVVLTASHFFSGLSVVIDHGSGIQSMYFHLDSITVKEMDVVSKDQVIGHMGSTGRATGPHLHWGVRVNGARVDPLGLTDVSRRLEEK